MGTSPPEKQAHKFDNFLSRILPTFSPMDIRNKKARIDEYIKYMLNRTSRIFEWKNLPDTIPQRIIELYLQTNGNVCIYKYNEKLYAFIGGIGGEPDVYYMPTLYTIANPGLRLSVNAGIIKPYRETVDNNIPDKKINECIVIPSDTMYMGILPLIQKYATLLVENELSLYINIINSRIPVIVGADNNTLADSAKFFFDDIEKGKLGMVATNQFFDGLKSVPYTGTASRTLTDLLEIEQYLKASLYNDIGLQSNYNMKRERLTDDETALNETALLPLIDDMLYYRKKGCEEINAKWGTNISVEISGAWKVTQDSVRTEIEENTDNNGGGENAENTVI